VKYLILLFVTIFLSTNALATNLLQALEAAKQNNSGYAAAINAKTAGGEKAEQSTALLLPNLELGVGHTRYGNSDQFDDEAVSNTSLWHNSYGYSIDLSYPLYDADNLADARRLETEARISKIRFDSKHQGLILQVAAAYFDHVLANEKLKTVLAQKASVEEQLNHTIKLHEIGLAIMADLQEAKASFDRIVSDEIRARNTLKITGNRFSMITGLPANDLAILASLGEPQKLSEESLEEWLSRAETSNPTIYQQKLQLEISQSEENRFDWHSLVKLDLLASYQRNWNDPELPVTARGKVEEDYLIGVQLTVPLYTGGLRTSRLRESRANTRQQTDLLNMELDKVNHETQRAFLAVNSSAANYQALKQVVSSSEQLLEETKVGRRADLRTTSDVLRANQNLHSARFELTASRYNHLYNRLKLAYVAGELKENDLQEINEMLMPRAVAESARQVEPALQKAIIGLHGISLTRNRLIDLQQD